MEQKQLLPAPFLLLLLLLSAVTVHVRQARAQDDELPDSTYNETYLDPIYGYEAGYFATIPDPYDDSKSWSIEGEEGEIAAAAAMEAAADPDAAEAGMAGVDINPLYVYDNCIYNTDGSFAINGTRDCDLEIRGIDRETDLLAGGVDGTYTLAGCFEGKPWYQRLTEDGEDRSLYHHPYMGSWEVSIGPEPDEDQIVMYGDMGQVSPLDVPRWHVSASFNTEQVSKVPEDEDLYYVAYEATVACVGEPHIIKQQAWADAETLYANAGRGTSRHGSLRITDGPLPEAGGQSGEEADEREGEEEALYLEEE